MIRQTTVSFLDTWICVEVKNPDVIIKTSPVNRLFQPDGNFDHEVWGSE